MTRQSAAQLLIEIRQHLNCMGVDGSDFSDSKEEQKRLADLISEFWLYCDNVNYWKMESSEAQFIGDLIHYINKKRNEA